MEFNVSTAQFNAPPLLTHTIKVQDSFATPSTTRILEQTATVKGFAPPPPPPAPIPIQL